MIWPDVDRALRDELRGAGLGQDLVDDVLQDVAVHALADRAPQDPAAFIEWAQPLAASLAAHVVGQPNSLDLALLVDRPGAQDVPYEVSRRLALEAVLRAVAAMSEVDRAAVLAGLDYGSQPSLAEARTVAVRRFRARRVLARIVESFGVVAVWRLARRALPRVAVPAATLATATAVVVTLVPAEQPLSLMPPPRVLLLKAPPYVARPVATRRNTTAVTLSRSAVAAPKPTPYRPAVPEPRSPATSGVVIEAPGGTRIEHRQVERHPDDRLACIYGTVMRPICTPDPGSSSGLIEPHAKRS